MRRLTAELKYPIAAAVLGSVSVLSWCVKSRTKKNKLTKLKEQREKAHTDLRSDQNLALSKLAKDMRKTHESPEYYQEQARKASKEIEASYKKKYSECPSLEEFYPNAEQYPYNKFTQTYVANQESDAMEYVSASVQFQLQIALLLQADCLSKNNPIDQCAEQYQSYMRNLALWQREECARIDRETPKFKFDFD